MDEDYDEPMDEGDALFAEQRFEMDGPGLFGSDEPAQPPEPAAAPPDAKPAVTHEPDDGLSDDPEEELLIGGADFIAPDAEAGQPPSEDDLGAETMAQLADVELDADAEVQDGADDGPAPTVAGELQAPAGRGPRAVDDAPAAPLALYRRYRPETFAEVIGQEHVTDPLQRALTNNKVNHAYLFSGPRGCGKTTSARILARCLNCEQGPTPTPCGECQSCRDLARGGNGSIDVIEIDAASHGGVEDTRDLRERAFFAPVHSRYKIYIIDEAHMVTTAGFNAMLKLVEEPPPHVKFIFATTEPEKVIGTIRSRTHHYPFRLVPPKVLQNYLGQLCEAEGVQVDHTVLPLVVRAGAGSVRDSLSVLDQLLGGAADDGVSYAQASALLGYTPDALLDEIMDAFAAGDSAGVFATIDKVIEVGQDPRRFAEDLLRRLRDLVIVAAVPDAVSSGLIDVAADQAERLETQASGMGAGELTRAAEVIATGLTDMRGTTAPRLHLELMCARVLLPGADVDDRGIHARLDRLERRVGMPGAPVAADPDAGHWTPDELGAPAQSGGAPGGEAVGRGQATGHAPSGRPGQQAAPGPGVEADQGDSGPAGSGQVPQQQRRAPGAPQDQPGAAQDQGRGGGLAQPGQHDPAAVGRQQDDRGRTAGQASTPGHAGQAQPGPEQPSSQGQRPAQPQGQRPATPQGQRPATPQGQRPAAAQGQRPAGGGQRPAGQPVGQSAPAAEHPGGQSAAPRGVGASISVVDVRRLWPQVLETVKSRRRFAWILLSQNAQVVDVDGNVLVLGFANQGARDSFASGGSQDILRDAMVEVMGADLRINAILEGGGGRPSGGGQPPTAGSSSHGQGSPSGAAGGSAAPQQAAPQQGGAAGGQSRPADGAQQPAPASGDGHPGTGSPSDTWAQQPPPAPVPPHGDGDPGPSTPVSAPPPDEPPETSRWTQQARHNIRPTAKGPAPDEPEVDESQLVSEDDETLDESGESAAELITRTLGAKVIAEEEPGL